MQRWECVLSGRARKCVIVPLATTLDYICSGLTRLHLRFWAATLVVVVAEDELPRHAEGRVLQVYVSPTRVKRFVEDAVDARGINVVAKTEYKVRIAMFFCLDLQQRVTARHRNFRSGCQTDVPTQITWQLGNGETSFKQLATVRHLF